MDDHHSGEGSLGVGQIGRRVASRAESVSSDVDVSRGLSQQADQLVGASAGSVCSTSSPSIVIWMSSLTTKRPSSIMLKFRP